MPHGLLLLLLAAPDISVQAEGGAAHFLAAPQSNYFGFGEALSVRGDLTVWGPLAVQLSGTFVNVDAQAAFLSGPGRVLEAGAGLKARGLRWFWADAQLLLIGTGPLVRFGYELGVGATFFVTHFLGLGPYVRFLHIVQPDEPGVDGSDALMLHGGLAVTLRLGSEGSPEPVVQQKQKENEQEPEKPAPPPTPPPVMAVEPAPTPPPGPPPASLPDEPAAPAPVSVQKKADSDGDGIPDSRDACPNEPEIFNGVDDEDGCPDPKAGPAIVKLSEGNIEVVPQVRYDRQGHVDASSLNTVVTLARVLALHTELARVHITVFDPNLDVANKRAGGVLKVLLDVGLPPDRVEVEGQTGKGRLEVHVLTRSP
jgi:hypothetical protein